VRPELVLFVSVALAASGCARAQDPAANQAQPANVAQAPASPTELAQRLVVQRLGGQRNVSFGEAQVFTNNGATVVCGRYSQAGQPQQRFMTIGEEDVFVEGEFVGDINQAMAEACRNS